MRRHLLFWMGMGLAAVAGCTTPIPIAPAELPDGAVGMSYMQTLQANSSNSLWWEIVGGELPPGVLLSATSGVLAGTPTAAGTYSFTIAASGGSDRGEASYTISIAERLTATVALPAGRAGSDYTGSISAHGGSTPYTFKVLGLPGGMTYDAATGGVSGNPTTVGSWPLQITVTDSGLPQQTTTVGATLTVKGPALSITTTSLPDATVGQTDYSATLQASGGEPPYTWSAAVPGTLGALPTGLELNRDTGVISNSRNSLGAVDPVDGSQPSCTFTISVTDDDNPPTTVTQELTINVVQPGS